MKVRVMECVRLRVSSDVDFEQSQIIVRISQDMRNRSTRLPNQLRSLLVEHMKQGKINQQRTP